MGRTVERDELRANTSAILREVAAGTSFTITENGEVVALLVPPGPSVSLLSQRRPTRIRGGFGALPRARLDHPVRADLDELRGDR